MTTTPVDPQIRALAIRLAGQGKSIRAIGDATGLIDREVRAILQAPTERPTNGTRRPAPARPAPQPSFRPPTPVAPAAAPPKPAPSQSAPAPAAPLDTILELIDQAVASDIRKVRTAGKRVAAAIDYLREVMEATEAERAEKAAAKALAAREAAERAERERVARVTVEALERQLQEAKANLQALVPAKRTRRPMSDEERARARERMLHARAVGDARRREAKQAQQ